MEPEWLSNMLSFLPGQSLGGPASTTGATYNPGRSFGALGGGGGPTFAQRWNALGPQANQPALGTMPVMPPAWGAPPAAPPAAPGMPPAAGPGASLDEVMLAQRMAQQQPQQPQQKQQLGMWDRGNSGNPFLAQTAMNLMRQPQFQPVSWMPMGR
jgi:hypothetical protein